MENGRRLPRVGMHWEINPLGTLRFPSGNLSVFWFSLVTGMMANSTIYRGHIIPWDSIFRYTPLAHILARKTFTMLQQCIAMMQIGSSLDSNILHLNLCLSNPNKHQMHDPN